MRYRDSLLGILGLDSVTVEKIWPSDIMVLLGVVGEMITNAFVRKRSEMALKEHARRLRTLATRLVVTEEAERQRLARELHDQVGQNLSVLSINMSIVEKKVKKGGGRVIAEFFDLFVLFRLLNPEEPAG